MRSKFLPNICARTTSAGRQIFDTQMYARDTICVPVQRAINKQRNFNPTLTINLAADEARLAKPFPLKR